MSTSGYTLFELSRDQLINAAYRKLGMAYDQTANTAQITNGAQALNTVLAKLQAIGMPLWARKEYTFVLTNGVATYQIGVGKTINTPFPLKIHQAILLDSLSGSSIEMEIRSIYDYNRYSPASSSGQPIQLFYQPQVNYGTITLWPTPDASSVLYKTVKILYQRPFEDFVSGADTPDFPQEWHQAIIYQLAATLAPEWGIPLPDRQMLMQEAKMYTEECLGFGVEEASLFLQPMERP